ncbi:chromosome segregation protein SMC [Paracoccus shanxieyensis]|uniref:Chromosome partition protein Smc n=1 Tax=Paracoccus shanxieyensis TaxID=2675752 RepID=A0A6L6J0A0_9RHOB|nr:chromosome segregation protein SMC [Paracoccus shanxieyensis]MTH65301.1 chromosome segregation protein SMC [Paracoccus shanxieyensis]MTH88395.1 chromosome segregation protein SMC [Paracoccus shanxieyensis]
MRFDRLRLNGFKSFVDPTDLVIHEGLTGVVGPNGCGKSNLLEALRWVMGENRPTAMRGEGMEDVIFAGTTRRSARAHAEVTLTIDNHDRLAPAGMNDSDALDITRRITRDAGSAYRINGKDVRARDVQILFADASTGAHSPALVRQGQISELINAKPKARRRILEEAAGISGLYQRRHEAELKLNAAEANLTRVDDTLDQLSTQAASLARQARAAARYREIGAALRRAEGLLLYRRWAEADHAKTAALAALQDAIRAAAEAEAQARHAIATREDADATLPPLREEEQIAAAILSRATVEREALDEAEARAAQAIKTFLARIAQLDRDIEREAALNRDAGEVIDRLDWERRELEKAGQGHDDRHDIARDTADEAAEALREVEAKLTELTDESARLAARHQSAERLAHDLRQMQDRATRASDAAEMALATATDAGAEAEATREAAAEAQETARERVEQAEEMLAEAEDSRATLEAEESAARATRAEAEGELSALNAEMAALKRLVERGDHGGSVLELVRVARGHEAAFGAALGDDLSMGLAQDGSGWHALPGYDTAHPLPKGTEPLAPHVQAPEALARRMSQVGLVADAAAAAALQAALRPGQRLVTPQGDLLRWDGMRVMAGEASSSAAMHLQKVNQLAEMTVQAGAAQTRATEAADAHQALRDRHAAATEAEKRARDARRDAERGLSDAARAVTRAESDLSLTHARAESARAELARHQADAADARARLRDAERALADLPDRAAVADALEHARMGVEAARIATMTRRGALDELRREAAARTKRLQEITKEESGWRLRLDQAGTRAAELSARRDQTADELEEAEAQPEILAERRAQLTEAEAQASARLTRARAALSAAEATQRAASDSEREAQRLASEARETRAAREARADAATEAEAAARLRIHDDAETTPEALLETLGEAEDISPAALEDQIARLRASRDALGAVNLRADEDKQELETERDRLAAEKDDLTEAIRKLRQGIGSLNREGRERLLAAFDTVNANFTTLFTHLFGGGEARLVLVESDDPLDAGLEIMCQPPGKKLSTLSLLSGGEQTLTAMALIFAVFLANPAPICVLDEVDAPLDDANVTRFCDLMDEMTRRTDTRFLVITHHAVTMARMDRLFGVTMVEQGVSQLVSVDLKRAEALVA